MTQAVLVAFVGSISAFFSATITAWLTTRSNMTSKLYDRIGLLETSKDARDNVLQSRIDVLNERIVELGTLLTSAQSQLLAAQSQLLGSQGDVVRLEASNKELVGANIMLIGENNHLREQDAARTLAMAKQLEVNAELQSQLDQLHINYVKMEGWFRSEVDNREEGKA